MPTPRPRPVRALPAALASLLCCATGVLTLASGPAQAASSPAASARAGLQPVAAVRLAPAGRPSAAGGPQALASAARIASAARAPRADRAARGSALGYGLAQLGKPYRRGGTGPSAYDCSGLVGAGYRAAGLGLPRTAAEQYRRLPHVPRAGARPGDLLFWAGDPHRPRQVTHVAMYLGSGMILTAPRTGTTVQIKPVYTQGLLPQAARVPAGALSQLLPITPADSGGPVLAVQRRLVASGYRVPQDGRYGTATRDAVGALQRRVGLRATGVVDAATWDVLVRRGLRDRVR
ncbi:MAG: NlpC/P60 family protein [Kineosporiaceae bacterium]